MEPKTVIFLIWLVFILCGFFAWFFWQRARHKERMMMIEKGLDPNSERPKDHQAINQGLTKLGIIAIGLGIGLGIIAVCASLHIRFIDSGPAPIAVLALCIGAAMIYANQGKK